jgi:hypothetical protein
MHPTGVRSPLRIRRQEHSRPIIRPDLPYSQTSVHSKKSRGEPSIRKTVRVDHDQRSGDLTFPLDTFTEALKAGG